MIDEGALHEKVKCALSEFFDKDCNLLRLDVNERSITHKLAEHLQRQFEDLKVDCEYNRHLKDIKRLPIEPEDIKTDCLDAKTVYPDIVVHRREVDNCNRLVIEAKKSTQDAKYDEGKLRAFTSPENDYKYAMGLLLVFDVSQQRIESAKCFRRGRSRKCVRCESLREFCGN